MPCCLVVYWDKILDSCYRKEFVSLVVETQVIRETGVAVAKDWKTSRTMFFQGGEYVTCPIGTPSIITTIVIMPP